MSFLKMSAILSRPQCVKRYNPKRYRQLSEEMGPKTKGKGAKKARREAVGPSASTECTQPKVRQQQEVFLPVPLLPNATGAIPVAGGTMPC